MRFTNEFTDEKLLCILKHSPKIKFDQGATPEESLVSFSVTRKNPGKLFQDSRRG